MGDKRMEEKITSNKKTARTVGTLFIIATIAGLLSVAGTGPLHTPDYLITVAAHESQIIMGALLVLIMGVAIALIPVVLFPILKKYNESLALGYVIFRTLEVVTFIAIAISFLLLLALSREYIKVGSSNVHHYQTLGSLLLTAVDWINFVTIIVFSISALLLNFIFYRSKLIPRWLAGWGFVGAGLHLAGGLFGMFGFDQMGFLAVPIALQEMVYAIWLIVKGFDVSAITFEAAKQEGILQ
jgi:hypothetical protein